MCTNQRTGLSLYAYNTLWPLCTMSIHINVNFVLFLNIKCPAVSVSNILSNFEQKCKNYPDLQYL